MSRSVQEIRFLHWKGIYPEKYGGNLRTINLARIASGFFNRTTVFSMDNAQDFEGNVSGIPVIQEKVRFTPWQKIRYSFHALTATELQIPFTPKAFIKSEECVFQIEYPRFYPLLKKKNISRFIIDEQNVSWDLPVSAVTFKERIYASLVYQREKDNEIQALTHASHVLCCSSRDREILLQEIPDLEGRISVIPNCVNIIEYETIDHSASVWGCNREKGRIFFVGLMTYAPNIEAAGFICRDIAPHLPDCEFLIAGKNPPAIPCAENVRFTGYLEDARPAIAESDICIAPLRSGSGTRIKILEYMAMGKPVISTSKGAEGIEYTDGLNIIIEDTIEKYPEIIRELLNNEQKRHALGRQAKNLIREKYDWGLYRSTLGRIYEEISRVD